MEQKRTLWIISAAGIFLLVVFGAALILYSKPMQPVSTQIANSSAYNPSIGWTNTEPQKQLSAAENNTAFTTETAATTMETQVAESDNTLKLSPFAKSENTQEQNSQIHSDKVTVISDNATVYSNTTTTIDLNALKSSSNSGIVAKNELTANQINTNRAPENLPPPPVREVYSQPQENYYTPAPVAKAPASKPAASAAPKKAVSTSAKSSAVAKAPAQTKASTAAKVASSAKKAPDSFWVQAAAYTSKRNADEARSTLESNKITSEVFTYTDSNGKTFYRVRVGPYVTKSEAEYWQTRISMIDKFAESKSVIVNTAVN
ncbi:SPOR domain-containing protein [Treponema sp.]|uniref:SPOR domain-containing protein n=1 Tax=Treponema sp. TaxID=166 RepID=UPI003890D2B8